MMTYTEKKLLTLKYLQIVLYLSQMLVQSTIQEWELISDLKDSPSNQEMQNLSLLHMTQWE